MEGEEVAGMLPDRARRSEHAYALRFARTLQLPDGALPVLFHRRSTLARGLALTKPGARVPASTNPPPLR